MSDYESRNKDLRISKFKINLILDLDVRPKFGEGVLQPHDLCVLSPDFYLTLALLDVIIVRLSLISLLLTRV